MTRIDFDELRTRYTRTLELYRHVADNVLEHSKGGARPPKSELVAEEQTLWELAILRREFLDALETVCTLDHARARSRL